MSPFRPLGTSNTCTHQSWMAFIPHPCANRLTGLCTLLPADCRTSGEICTPVFKRKSSPRFSWLTTLRFISSIRSIAQPFQVSPGDDAAQAPASTCAFSYCPDVLCCNTDVSPTDDRDKGFSNPKNPPEKAELRSIHLRPEPCRVAHAALPALHGRRQLPVRPGRGPMRLLAAALCPDITLRLQPHHDKLWQHSGITTTPEAHHA